MIAVGRPLLGAVVTIGIVLAVAATHLVGSRRLGLALAVAFTLVAILFTCA